MGFGTFVESSILGACEVKVDEQMETFWSERAKKHTFLQYARLHPPWVPLLFSFQQGKQWWLVISDISGDCDVSQRILQPQDGCTTHIRRKARLEILETIFKNRRLWGGMFHAWGKSTNHSTSIIPRVSRSNDGWHFLGIAMHCMFPQGLRGSQSFVKKRACTCET